MTRGVVHRPTTVVLLALMPLVGVACADGGRLTDPVEVTSPPSTEAAGIPECTDAQAAAIDPLASYDPLSPMPADGQMPPGSPMARIQDNGRLVVGVSGDTLQFGARNAQTGRIEGFDVDLLREIAKAIFDVGNDEVDNFIEFVIIPYSQRLPKLEAGEVDVVAHTMTINCRRWNRIAFSAEYFRAGGALLVKNDSAATSLADLGGAEAIVCAPAGSTNLDYLATVYPAELTLVVPDITDCLIALQDGTADAATGDNTVLAGLMAQDPNLRMLEGDLLTQEPYGFGFNAADVDLARYVNGLLERWIDDGTWQELHRRWLGVDGEPPTPLYGREAS